MTRSRWMLGAAGVVAAAVAAGCRSREQETPPDRPLFRLATSGEAPVVQGEIIDDGSLESDGPAVAAYMAALRFVRIDGTAAGAVVTAPRLTVYPGQRANVDTAAPAASFPRA